MQVFAFYAIKNARKLEIADFQGATLIKRTMSVAFLRLSSAVYPSDESFTNEQVTT